MDLKSYLENYGIRPSTFARKAQVCRSYVHRLMRETRNPSKYVKKRMEIASEGKITMDDWPKEKGNKNE